MISNAECAAVYAIVDELKANGGHEPDIGAIARRLRCSHFRAQSLVIGLKRRGLYSTSPRPMVSASAFQFVRFENEEARKTGQGLTGF